MRRYADVILSVDVIEHHADDFDDRFFSQQLIENRFLYDFRYVCIVYIKQVRFERSATKDKFRYAVDLRFEFFALRYYVDRLYDSFNGYVENIAYDQRHFARAVSPLLLALLSVECEVRHRAYGDTSEVFARYRFLIFFGDEVAYRVADLYSV